MKSISRVWMVATLLVWIVLPSSSFASQDPLNSVNWEEMKDQFIGDSAYVFDERVKVIVPSVLENQAQVPVSVDARDLPNVRKIVVFADFNPIQHVLTLTPLKAKPFISFRMKVEQATPVRAAVLTADGVWHIGGIYLDATGGGCSSPAMARQKEDWSTTLGHTRGRLWPQLDGSTRVRLTVRHPMDTGLTPDNIPAFYIETLQLRSSSGVLLALVNIREPVSEDPTMTLHVKLPLSDDAVLIEGRDIGGNIYPSKIPARWKQSRAILQNSTLTP